LSERKINTIELTQKSTVSCFEYYDKALSCQDNKEKIYYFHKAIEQDYRNEYGIKVYALDNIGSIYTDLGQPSKGIAYFKEALKIDPNCGAEKNLAYAQDIKQAIEEEQRRRYAEKEEKWNRTIATLNAVGSGLSAAGNALEQSSSTTTNYSSSNSTASTQKNSQSKNSNDNNNTLSANLNCKNIQNAYYGQIDNIRKIQNDWLDHSAHDAKNNTNLIGKDRQILRDVLKGIADIKKSISGKDCSIQINYELEEWARAHAN
jgi:tetratricopeptide (TPR) repeat protein